MQHDHGIVSMIDSVNVARAIYYTFDMCHNWKYTQSIYNISIEIDFRLIHSFVSRSKKKINRNSIPIYYYFGWSNSRSGAVDHLNGIHVILPQHDKIRCKIVSRKLDIVYGIDLEIYGNNTRSNESKCTTFWVHSLHILKPIRHCLFIIYPLSLNGEFNKQARSDHDASDGS